MVDQHMYVAVLLVQMNMQHYWLHHRWCSILLVCLEMQHICNLQKTEEQNWIYKQMHIDNPEKCHLRLKKKKIWPHCTLHLHCSFDFAYIQPHLALVHLTGCATWSWECTFKCKQVNVNPIVNPAVQTSAHTWMHIQLLNCFVLLPLSSLVKNVQI